jgi:hypothetical protein
MENTRSRDTGGFGEKVCEPCDDCYNLVSDAANVHRHNLAALDSLLQQVMAAALFMRSIILLSYRLILVVRPYSCM